MRTEISPGDTLATARLGASPQELKYQFQIWHEATSPLFDTAPLAAEDTLAAGGACYLVDRILFTRVHFGRMKFCRSSRHLRQAENDSIVLQYYRSGSFRGQQGDDSPLVMAADRILIHDFAHPFHGVAETGEAYGVVIPRDLVPTGDHFYRGKACLSWPLASPAGGLMAGTLDQLWDLFPTASRQDGPALAAGFLGLFNSLLAASLQGRQAPLAYRPHLYQAMIKYLRANLQHANLSVDDLCRHFHCSRATAYRLFKDHGGIQNYLREQRITRCFQALSGEGGQPAARVREVAEAWGFFDAAHFNRLFKKRYGLPPSEIAGYSRSRSSEPTFPDTDAQRLREWLRHF